LIELDMMQETDRSAAIYRHDMGCVVYYGVMLSTDDKSTRSLRRSTSCQRFVNNFKFASAATLINTYSQRLPGSLLAYWIIVTLIPSRVTRFKPGG